MYIISQKANKREKVGEQGGKKVEINFGEKTYSECGKLKKSNGNKLCCDFKLVGSNGTKWLDSHSGLTGGVSADVSVNTT